MAQQQAFALPLGYLDQRLANGGLFLQAYHHARRTDQVGVGRLQVGALQTTHALQARARPPGRAQAIERLVEADPPQPGADLAVGSRLQRRVMRKLEERLLECVLGFHSVAEDAVYEAEHLGIELREERVEALFCSGSLLGHLLLELQHAGFRCVVAIHR